MPKLYKLLCVDNHLEELPKLPNIIKVNCSVNKIAILDLANVVWLHCWGNNLIYLAPMPNLLTLVCYGNPDLQTYDLNQWKEIWKEPMTKL